MTKEKRSFMERLTGSKKIEGNIHNEGMEHMRIHTEDDMEPTSFPTRHDEDWGNREERQPMQSGEWEHEENHHHEETSKEDDDGELTIDVYQTDSDIIVKSTIAGVKPEDLDVSINNDMITIKGERKFEDEVKEEDFYYQECYWGSFARSVVLPVDVLPEKAEASLKNGILTIRIPKAEINKVKKIQVRGF